MNPKDGPDAVTSGTVLIMPAIQLRPIGISLFNWNLPLGKKSAIAEAWGIRVYKNRWGVGGEDGIVVRSKNHLITNTAFWDMTPWSSHRCGYFRSDASLMIVKKDAFCHHRSIYFQQLRRAYCSK
jgi:hypothetical protein